MKKSQTFSESRYRKARRHWPSHKSNSLRSKKRLDPPRNSEIVPGKGVSCPRCGEPTQIRKHKSITERIRRQPYHFEKWFYCTNERCKATIINDSQYKVHNRASQPVDLFGNPYPPKTPPSKRAAIGVLVGSRATKKDAPSANASDLFRNHPPLLPQIGVNSKKRKGAQDTAQTSEAKTGPCISEPKWQRASSNDAGLSGRMNAMQPTWARLRWINSVKGIPNEFDQFCRVWWPKASREDREKARAIFRQINSSSTTANQ
jgi:hypothetical protein